MAIKTTQVPLLKQLCKCNKKLQKDLLKKGGKPLHLCLKECALNVIKGNVPLSKHQFRKIKKHKNQLREISKKNTSQKRRIKIEQRGGFIASLLIPIIGSLAGGLIKKAIHRK